MTEFLKYILESGIALAIFYLFYEVGLKRETCFAQNRLYLLVTPILSFLLPLFNLPIYFYTENPTNTVFELSPVQVITTEAVAGSFSWVQLLIYLYLLGLVIVFSRMAIDFWRMNLLIERYKEKFVKEGRYFEVTSPEFKATFSFLNFIFWKEDPHLSQEDRMKIRKHELIHVRQKHSYDLIYIKFLCGMLWFNPIIWMYRVALENTHEFLADHSVIDQEDKYSYIRLLVSEIFRDSGFDTVHHFGKSRTSRRIEMMKLKSYVSDKGRFLLMIPISLVLLLVFSFEVRQVDISELNEAPVNEPSLDITITKNDLSKEDYILIQDDHIQAKIHDLTVDIDNIDSRAKMDKALELINSLNLEFASNHSNAKQLPEFPGGSTAWNHYLQHNFNFPVQKDLEGKVFVEFVVMADGRIENVTVVKGLQKEINQESIRVVRSSPRWIPGKVEGKPVSVKMIVPIVIRMG